MDDQQPAVMKMAEQYGATIEGDTVTISAADLTRLAWDIGLVAIRMWKEREDPKDPPPWN